MDLPGLNFKPSLGVQAAIRHRFDEPVNFFPVSGLSKFSHYISWSLQVQVI
jgi:hypothetical protein